MSPSSKYSDAPAAPRRAVVFDLDGTLVDSAPDLHAAANAFLAERGHATPEHVAAALPRFSAIYSAAPSALSSLYPGVTEALARLEADGLVLGICTNKPEVPARRVVEDFALARFFSGLVGGDSLARRKPDPAPLHHLAGLLQVEERAVIFVGDSEVDAATAAAAGVPFMLFTEGYRKSPVEAIPHAARFSHFDALRSLIASQPAATA